mmetsp:Transcript_78756/g.228645  ORF Transcript_78756/g.228645 Transcript_78756/m.228645 type:complete len:248 (-) Transcript_78756:452-1195(-)
MDTGLQLVLGPLQLPRRDPHALKDARQLLDEHGGELRHHSGIDREEASVGVHQAAGLAALDPIVPIQHLRVQPRVHALSGPSCGEGPAPSEEHVKHRGRGEHWPIPATLDLPSQHQVAERVRLANPDLAARVPRGLHLPLRAGLLRPVHADLGEAARRPLAEVVEVDVHAHEHEPVGPALPADVLADVLCAELRQVRFVGVQRVAQCIASIGGGVHQLSHQALCVFLHRLSHFHGLLPRRLDLLLED